MSSNLKIIGETTLRIRHCLIANRGVSLKYVKEVYSHPQALAQSRKRLEELDVEMIPFSDTAGSVRMIKERKLMNAVGVASRHAASVYGMSVLESNLETDSNNYTRFFVMSKADKTNGEIGSKTSLA